MPYQSIEPTKINGVFVMQPKVFGDERGWYCPDVEFSELEEQTGTKLNLTQIASSFNAQKGVLRGMHYQKPDTQGKLVRVVSGSVQDVVVDLRRQSPTFGQYFSIVLTASTHNQLLVPVGCAHGYLALEDNTQFNYLVTEGRYNTSAEHGINPFDPEIGIEWLLPSASMSLKDRDLALPKLSEILVDNLF